MKILLITLNYSPEIVGIGKYSSEMAEWLDNIGHDVNVICAPPYYPEWKVHAGWSAFWYSKETINNVSVIRCPILVPKRPSGVKRILHLLSFWFSSFPVILSNVFWKPDLVITIEPPFFCATSALLLTKLSKSKAILHIQDFEVDAAFELGLLKSKYLRGLISKVERNLLSKFDCVSTISPKMLEKLSEKEVSPKNQYLFTNWVDTNLISKLNSPSEYIDQLGLSADSKVLLYSGNMGNKQGLEIIISAAKKLETEKNIVFLLCGEGSAKSKLQDMASDLSNIIWLPFQPLDRLNQFLGLATVHLLPQAKEAADLVMPSKLTGMLSSGRPIIATAAIDTQVGEIVSKCGILVPPDDLVALVNAIIMLINDDDLCQKFGIMARDIAEKELDIHSVLSRFDNKIKNLISH